VHDLLDMGCAEGAAALEENMVRLVWVVATRLQDWRDSFVADTDCRDSCHDGGSVGYTVVRCDEEVEVGPVAHKWMSDSHNLQAGRNIGLGEVAQWESGMPQGCKLDIQASRKRLTDYHMAVGCIAIVLGGIVRDCRVVDLRVVRRIDVGAGTQPKGLSVKTFASARKHHCSRASSGHGAIHDYSLGRMLNILPRLPEQIRHCPEAADQWETSRCPKSQNSVSAGGPALDTLAEMDGVDIDAGGIVVFHQGGHSNSGHLSSPTWSPRPGVLLLRHRLLHMGRCRCRCRQMEEGCSFLCARSGPVHMFRRAVDGLPSPFLLIW
jgi:hypothetical protein